MDMNIHLRWPPRLFTCSKRQYKTSRFHRFLDAFPFFLSGPALVMFVILHWHFSSAAGPWAYFYHSLPKSFSTPPIFFSVSFCPRVLLSAALCFCCLLPILFLSVAWYCYHVKRQLQSSACAELSFYYCCLIWCWASHYLPMLPRWVVFLSTIWLGTILVLVSHCSWISLCPSILKSEKCNLLTFYLHLQL